MKQNYFSLLSLLTCMLLLGSCSKDISAPTLPEAQSDLIPQGVALSGDVLFGTWEGKTITEGGTNSNTFEQSYRVEFQSLEDAEALYSHWYADARTNDRDSVCDVVYGYTFDGTTVDLTPKTAGLSKMKFVHTGDNHLQCFAIEGDHIQEICTLTRTRDPEPTITEVDRTLPQTGETVIVYGRNLQFVDRLYLPTTGGEREVTDFTKSSKMITFSLPADNYKAGSVRALSEGAGVNTYSPAYMFCNDCVFFSTFVDDEFANTIGMTETKKLKCLPIAADNIPAGHSLDGVSVINPAHFISFFDNTPIAWELDAGTDNSWQYLRFSNGDRFRYVLGRCGGLLTDDTPCSEAAIQMDIYVYSDGQPQWNTGYLSYRMNKNHNGLTASDVAHVTMWEKGAPASFADGWHTLTIPLSKFKWTGDEDKKTLGDLTTYLISNKVQAMIKLMNHELNDGLHPTTRLETFQFNIANIRLVPYKLPNNTKK
ncbi:MAG: hypothetical protein ILA25_01190 [Prevotella sp.]|nr:hypothetical protein [Prevotella sp.]